MKPNILFLVFDGLRAKSLRLFNTEANLQTPALTSFAREATVYKNAFTTYAGSIPAHKALFTGLLPSQNGAYGGDDTFLFEHSLPSMLKREGYETYGFSSHSTLSDRTSFDQGFDEFVKGDQVVSQSHIDNMTSKEVYLNATRAQKIYYLCKYLISRRFSKRTISSIINKFGYNTVSNSTPVTLKGFKKIKKWISKNDKNPFFVFANIMQTHNNFNPPKSYRKEYGIEGKYMPVQEYIYQNYCDKSVKIDYTLLNKLYEAEIAFTDSLFGDLIDTIKSAGQYENTMIIVMSDHGEFLGEHGHVGHLFGLYNEVTHVPLIVKYPRKYRAGIIDEKLRQNYDVFHTICEMLKISNQYYSDELSLLNQTGRSRAISQIINVDLIVNEFKKIYPTLNMNELIPNHSTYSLVNKDFIKVIMDTSGGIEIYDYKIDYHEKNNLYNEKHSELSQNLIDECKKSQEETGFHQAVANSKNQTVSLEVLMEMKKLGYLPE
jgi:arylsulfatase A-like enzyme